MTLFGNSAFKDQDGNYLAAAWVDDHPCPIFETTYVKHSIVEHEIITNSDGSIHIKSKVTGKFWRTIYNGFIVADSDAANGTETLFWPVQVPNNSTSIALRSASNNRFCKKFILADNVTSGFCASSRTIDTDCCLEVEEAYN